MRINERYLKVFSTLRKYNFIYGGSSSGKTYSIVQYIILRMMRGEAAIVMRNTQTSIKKTVLNDFKEILKNTGLDEYFIVSKSFPLRIISKINTGECLFIGADKGAEDNKGVKPSNGAGKFTVFFADECDQITKNAIMQMRIRIRGTSTVEGAETTYIYSFNPTFRKHYLFEDFICPTGFDPYTDYELLTEDTQIARMTYRDNAFLAQSDIDELLNLGKQSKYFKQVYLDAEPGTLGKRCINSFETIKLDQVPSTIKNWLGGIDHGWNDPLACVWGCFDEKSNYLYITNELFKSEMDLNEAALILPHNIPFTGDSEDPRSNNTLSNKGINISGAKKGPGSVFGGIMYLNTLNIRVVDTCEHTIQALSNYSWKTDKTSGQTLDEPDHAFSDLCDAIRYMMERYSRGCRSIKAAKYSI